MAMKVKTSLWFRLRKWFFGIIKEFRRIQWTKRKDLFKNLCILIIFIAFFVGVFMGVDALFLDTGLLTGGQ